MRPLLLTRSVIEEVSGASASDTIRLIKDAAIRQLKMMDPRLDISKTDHFNHTFAPDMVITWPGRDSQERWVYLRLSDNARDLSHDIPVIGRHEPIVVSISRTGAEEVSKVGDGEIARDAVASDTMITDLDGMAAITANQKTSPTTKMLGATLARGGRGVFTPAVVEDAKATLDKGFAGAGELDSNAVNGATALLSIMLRPQEGSLISRFLEAIWVAKGGRISLFPGAISGNPALDDETWGFLLELEQINDLNFWRQLGASLSLQQLARLKNSSNLNLHNLVRANANRIVARRVRVLRREERLLEDLPDYDDWLWRTENGLLTLRGPNSTAYISDDKEAIAGVDNTRAPGLSVAEIRQRAKDRRVTRIIGSVGNEEIEIANHNRENVTSSESVSRLVAGRESQVQVVRAATMTDQDHTMNLDFTTSTSSAGSANALLPSHLKAVMPVLASFTAEELASLDDAFYMPDESRQGTLF